MVQTLGGRIEVALSPHLRKSRYDRGPSSGSDSDGHADTNPAPPATLSSRSSMASEPDAYLMARPACVTTAPRGTSHGDARGAEEDRHHMEGSELGGRGVGPPLGLGDSPEERYEEPGRVDAGDRGPDVDAPPNIADDGTQHDDDMGGGVRRVCATPKFEPGRVCTDDQEQEPAAPPDTVDDGTQRDGDEEDELRRVCVTSRCNKIGIASRFNKIGQDGVTSEQRDGAAVVQGPAGPRS